MGEVWEATAGGEGGFVRRVAIKRLLSEHGEDPAQARMFLDEARIASQLHHANVLSILDYGVVEGTPYQVLEYVDGVDAERLRQLGLEAGQPLSVELALHLCTEVAHALQHAHQVCDAAGRPLGIVHRDVSPSNILVSWTGDVKLADFGIALSRDRQEQTLAGVTKGKPAYMSPEQLTRGELDGRSDLFALGCVLHALLTGHSPLAGEDRMADLLAGKELELSDTIPAEVRELIARAVRRARHQRFQSAAEFAADSGKILAARLDRDARSLLSDWIARVRRAEEARPPAASRWAHPFLEVEQLLGGAVAPVPAVTAATEDTKRVSSAPPAPSERKEAPRGRTWHRPWPWPWLALALLGGLVSLLPGRLAPRDEPPSPPPAVAFSAPEPPPPEERAEVRAAVAPPPARGEVPAMPPTSPEPGRPVKQPARSRAGHTGGGAAARQPLSRGSGALAVGGEGALRAEILINGERWGYAPKLIELPLGEHILELVTPEGRHVGPERLQITEFHTPAAPLRWVLREDQAAPGASPGADRVQGER
ncbi:MAG: protein kinase [Myxococcaceae bacterium]|nr:protein kinase [Myxococcaceae bacterium]